MHRAYIVVLALSCVLGLAATSATAWAWSWGVQTVQVAQTVSSSPFAGRWSGTWKSNAGMGAGEISMKVEHVSKGRHIHFIKMTQAYINGFNKTTELKDGVLVSVSGAKMTFKLVGTDRMEVTYYNPQNGDRGRWDLKRQQ